MQSMKWFMMTVLVVSISACGSFVKRTEFNSTVEQLRATDGRLAAADDSLRGQLERMEFQMSQLTANLQSTFSGYDAQIAQLQGRIRVDMTAHFAVNDATLRDQDKDALGDFSRTIADFHPNIVVTVEGFTDPSGSADYNRWLGLQRAKAVREYLVANGLPAAQIRTVSYGEDKERQIKPGATGYAGESNRRVALVIDYVVS